MLVKLKYCYVVTLLLSDCMPTIRISDENYAYLLGVAARLQVEEAKPQSTNDAIDWIIKTVKKYKKTLEAEKTKEQT